MFKGPQETVRDNKSLSYPVFELPGVNCTANTTSNTNKQILDRVPHFNLKYFVWLFLH